MENAVKALFIAAGVLIGMMIISLGVSLFASLSDYVENAHEERASKKLQEFNEQFTKYINYNDETNKKEFVLTIQDVVTAANCAYENNLNYRLEEYDGNNYYVTIKLDGQVLEKTINEKSAEILSEGLGFEYKCSSTNVKINPNTKRVYEVNFSTDTTL